MKANAKRMRAVLALPGNERFKHFVTNVADQKKVWGLYQDGWGLAAAEDGAVVFPLWPAKEYALACATDEWAGFEAREISLDEFLETVLPKLNADKVLPGIFSTPAGKGVTPTIEQLKAAIEAELQKY